MALKSTIRKLRSNPHLLFVRVPSFLSSLCIIIGVVSLLILPLDEYSRRTYISENALLPGQVHAYFSGSEQNVFRGYKKELSELAFSEDFNAGASDRIQSIFRAAGLKVAAQEYKYTSSGITHEGVNVYAIIRAPRGDATEAIVLVAPWKTVDEQLNINGVSLALTLARYFKRWSLWSKDIIFVVTPDSKSGIQAWIDAYHDMQPNSVQPLRLKSGALQGALVIEYPFDHHFESLHIIYDGINGQLPNLDLINTAVSVSGAQMGIGTSLQEMWNHDDSYRMRLQTMLRGMLKQGFGCATGAHSSFMPYHIDAITLQAKGEGWQDEMALGRTVESICRSLNNLLEHLHQSFFFYLLMHTNRFVSIGTYLPSAMLVAGSFTIMALALWLRTGHGEDIDISQGSAVPMSDKTNLEEHESTKEIDRAKERRLALPLTFVVGLHLLGLIPLYLFNSLPHEYFPLVTKISLVANFILPLALADLLTRSFASLQHYLLIKSFSLLLLGLFLSTLATLNFSLSFIVGLLCTPLNFASRLDSHICPPFRYVLSAIGFIALNILSPSAVLLMGCLYAGIDVETVLTQAAFGWDVWGMWTQVVIWGVWWPAWLIGCTLLGSSFFNGRRNLGN